MAIQKNKKLGLKCPECNTGDQIYRQNGKTKEFFIGCTNYNCRWTANVPDATINKQFKKKN